MREPERERETRACGGSLPSQRGVPASFARNEGEKLKESQSMLHITLVFKLYLYKLWAVLGRPISHASARPWARGVARHVRVCVLAAGDALGRAHSRRRPHHQPLLRQPRLYPLAENGRAYKVHHGTAPRARANVPRGVLWRAEPSGARGRSSDPAIHARQGHPRTPRTEKGQRGKVYLASHHIFCLITFRHMVCHLSLSLLYSFRWANSSRTPSRSRTPPSAPQSPTPSTPTPFTDRALTWFAPAKSPAESPAKSPANSRRPQITVANRNIRREASSPNESSPMIPKKEHAAPQNQMPRVDVTK